MVSGTRPRCDRPRPRDAAERIGRVRAARAAGPAPDGEQVAVSGVAYGPEDEKKIARHTFLTISVAVHDWVPMVAAIWSPAAVKALGLGSAPAGVLITSTVSAGEEQDLRERLAALDGGPLLYVERGDQSDEGVRIAQLLLAVVVVGMPLLTAAVVAVFARGRLPLVARIE